MKKLTGAIGVAAMAMAASQAEAGLAPQNRPVDTSEQPAIERAEPTQDWKEAQYVSSRFRERYLMRQKIRGGLGTKGEPFVKDAHPKGPSWVNSPRGVDRFGKNINPKINVRRTYQRNFVR